MKYRNKTTGFILNTPCECKGEDWELLSPTPKISAEKVEEEAEEKPKKRTKK